MFKQIRWAYMWLVYAFLFLPIFIVIIYSFNNARFTMEWRGFTWRWYESLLANPPLIDAAINSLLLAVSVAFVATALGSLAALCIHRYRFAGKQVMQGSIYLLTVSPDIVIGISLLIVFVAVSVPLGFITMLVGHVTMAMPFVTVTVLARLMSFDENLIEAARDLGASEARALWSIMLPLMAPALGAGWLLSFTLSLDDVIIATFLNGPDFNVLPLQMYTMVTKSKPGVNALSAVMFVVTIVLVLLAQFLARPKKQVAHDI